MINHLTPTLSSKERGLEKTLSFEEREGPAPAGG